MIFLIKSQIQINFLDFFVKIANSNQFTGFFYSKMQILTFFLDFLLSNRKFKSIYLIFLVKNVNWNIIPWFFMLYQKFNLFNSIFQNWKFESINWIFLGENTKFFVKSQLQIDFLDFSCRNFKFKWIYRILVKKEKIYFLDFSCYSSN